jgi:thiol:disulfide interchange protein DsbD
MFATVAWLAWVLGQQAGIHAVLAFGIGAVLVAMAAWLYGRFVQAGTRRRALALVLAVSSLAVGVWLTVDGARGLPGSASSSAPSSAPSSQDTAWTAWSDRAVLDAVAEGRPVFVDFTAAWCVSCQANKKLVLERASVVTEFERRNVLRLRADWTSRDATIGAALARHGRNGVPLYLLYVPGEAEPRILPEILTVGAVTDALAAIR